VLALDALLRGDPDAGLTALTRRIEASACELKDGRLIPLQRTATAALEHVRQWLAGRGDAALLQAGARRAAMTLGRAWQLALLVEQAQWSLDSDADPSGVAAAERFASSPIDVLADIPLAGSRLLLR